MSSWIYLPPQEVPQYFENHRPPSSQVPCQVPTQGQGDGLDFDIDVCLPCDHCGELMEPGEEALEILYGVIGKGQKSGQPMVVESSLIDHPFVNLHIWCAAEFIKTYIYLEEDEPDGARYCAGCDAKLSGRTE